ncbi:MAG: GDP-L-fucose synthase, partial [Eubacterium sp.]
YPADFIYENLAIETNVIKAAHDHQVKKLLFLGSTCIYPKNIPQPMKETYLLSGCLEPTNEAYAIAKIAGLEMCKFFKRQYNDNFISCMPTNLYGPHDNFDLNTSHVLPALIRKFHEAKVNGKTEVEVWGTGKPLREFIYVDDMADACVFLMKHYNGEQQINIGTGEEISIANLAKLIGETVGFEGDIVFNPEMKDGMRRKLCDVHKVNRLGWKHQIDLKQGLKKTVQWYLDNQNPVKS